MTSSSGNDPTPRPDPPRTGLGLGAVTAFGGATEAGGARRRKVLVVDDDWISRNVLVRMLEAAGYDVRQADSGQEGLALAERDEIDAFLLDIRMPGLGGIELCRRLRGKEAYRMTPILFVTALDEQANLAEAFDAGCDDFITKPVNSVILKARLQGHLQKTAFYYQLERVRRNLNRYISPRTQRMVEAYSATGVLPPPQEREVCVFFSDVRGFTALTQEMPPSDLFSMLSRHLGEQVDLVYQYDGYIDKFGGDSVMAVFDGADMAERACRCALDILERADARRQAAGGGAVIKPGIGLHLGYALIGNIGSAEHLDYSVIGGTVNLAARLCGFAAPLTAVASRDVRDAVCGSGVAFVDEQQTRIRGVRAPVTVFRVARN